MLLAKINPHATFTQQHNPFEFTIVNTHYITALARPYQLGSASTNFEIVFGNYTEAIEASEGVEAKPAIFEQVSVSNVELTSEELAEWTSDDKVVLELIATKIGTSCEDFVNMN